MNITETLQQHKELFQKAKEELEASRLKQPDRQFPVRVKERTIAALQTRVTSLVNAKAEAVQEIDARIRSFQADIARLEKEVEDARNTLGISANDKRGTGVKNKVKAKTKTAKKKRT